MVTKRSIAVAGSIALVAGGVTVAGAGSASADTVDYGPSRVIGGPRSLTDHAQGLAIAPDGTTYFGSAGDDSVSVFGPRADGNVLPLRIWFAGGHHAETTIDVATDAMGNMYTLTNVEGDASWVLVYRPRYTPTTPMRRVWPRRPTTSLKVSARGATVGATPTSIDVFAPGATEVGPVRVLSGPRTGLAAGGVRDVAMDGRGWIWAATADAVLGFAPSANGDVAPAARIAGSRTGLSSPRHIGVDAANRLYVTDATRRSISAFAPTANGNVRPLRVLRGKQASINPREAAVALNGRIVTTRGSRAIQVFSTMFPKRPSAVRSVRVTGKTRAAKRKVRWAKPADNGGGAVQSYKLVFRKGSKIVKSVTLKPGRRSYTVKKSALRRGKLTVTVRAKNISGWSPKVVKRFRVR
ncbi:hypothetical protein H4N58_11895 [Mumia sp. ZJ1417]|uniref:hypothetical protein n=1 Tax=Mumia sp. ZJ1417 TaxID=2708082 RepID=UPI001423ED06|nr:hypothetical protein [Mumia sp. ZJ1417]QMW64934.1 hypothetical protein H4N58_11895 [Mumia sp. ZJ1417]